MSLLTFIAFCLATYRISLFAVKEDGPFDFMAHIRDRIGISYDEYSNVVTSNTFAKLLTCISCTSVWIAFLLFTVYLLNPVVFTFIAFPMAASAIVVFINERL